MGIIAKQSLRNTIITYAGAALGFVLTIFLYPNILSPAQYGLTRTLLAIALVASQFADLGMKSTIIRYFPTFRDKQSNHHGFLFLALAVPFAGLVAAAGLLALFRPFVTSFFMDSSTLLVNYFWFILPLMGFILFFHVVTAYLRVLYDTVMASFLNDIGIRILAILLLVIYFLDWISFTQFILIFVLTYAIILLALIAYLSRVASISLKPDFQFVNRTLVKKMANYSFYSFGSGVANVIVGKIDIIMIAAMLGLSESGIYAVAFYVGSSLRMIRYAVNKITLPVISDAFENNNFKIIKNIYHSSALNLLIASGFVLCVIVANLSNLMDILPPKYTGTVWVIVIIGVGYLIDLSTGFNGGIIINSKYYRVNFWFTLQFMGLAVVLNYLLIPVYGLIGAAIATASALVIHNLLRTGYVAYRFSIQPFQWRMGLVVLIGGVSLLVSYFIPQLVNAYVDAVIRSLIVAVLFLGPVWLLDISDNVNEVVDEGLRRVQQLMGR